MQHERLDSPFFLNPLQQAIDQKTVTRVKQAREVPATQGRPRLAEQRGCGAGGFDDFAVQCRFNQQIRRRQ